MDKDKEKAVNEIIESLSVGDWSLSNEREFIETLYGGRLNYFLIIFSLFMTAGFANTFTHYKSIVFYVGALVLFLVWLLLYRSYKKHDRIMRIIFNQKTEHPAHKIEKIMNLEGYTPKYKASKLMGVYLPWLCISLLLAFALAITCEKLT